jgi:hypothetical protein
MALTKPPVLPAWAEAGDKVQPSNAEIQAGWPLSNVPPSRQRFNWLLNFLANGIRYLTRRGMPDYGADETYMIGDRVIGDDGKTYRCIQDNNIGNAPSTSPLWWEEWAPSLSRLADLLQKQTYTAFTTAGAAPNFTLTPAPAITAYTAGQRFRIKFHAAGSGADVLNISGLGNKSLKQYDNTGAKVAAVIVGNMLTDVEYDGVDMIVMDQLPPNGTQYASNAEAQALSVANKAISPATLAEALKGANQSLSANGYQKLPGGLIIQWGTKNLVSNQATETITFPIAFPNAAFSFAASYCWAGASTSFMVSNGPPSTTGITLTHASNIGGTGSIRWIALGW